MLKDGVFTGKHGKNHIQGMVVDEEHGAIYYSFTTMLVKTDLEGKLLGSVKGLVGHLGCIARNPADGKIYGSLEYKHDSIGKGILRSLGGGDFSDGFYIAVFDPEQITRPEMSAQEDGVMRAVYLPEVMADYTGFGKTADGRLAAHRYGCSGIDGLTFAPLPGSADRTQYLYVAYGVYGDPAREDNDHQVLLCCDAAQLSSFARVLRQEDMHRSGPAAPFAKYFVYTGNTEYGVQNLEYDPFTGWMFMAVYAGKKPQFPNYDIFAVDMAKAPAVLPLTGLEETGFALTPVGAAAPERRELSGWRLHCGPYGMASNADGSFYMAEPAVVDGEQAAYVYRYAFDPRSGFRRFCE